MGERGCPSRGRVLSRQTNFKQENFQKTENCVSQGKDFIYPMKKCKISAFNIGLMESQGA